MPCKLHKTVALVHSFIHVTPVAEAHWLAHMGTSIAPSSIEQPVNMLISSQLKAL
jgi:hypothetical protein